MKLKLYLAVLMVAVVMILPSPVTAQFGKIKDKIKKEVEKKTEDKSDKEDAASDSSSADAVSSDPTKAKPAGSAGGTTTSEDMTLYTKFDFVPGDKVIFFDDFSSDELGEFPHRWNLDKGVFEVAKQGQDMVVVSTQTGFGSIRPRIPDAPLPPKYTVEFDFYGNDSQDYNQWYCFFWVDAKGEDIGDFTVYQDGTTRLRLQYNNVADKKLDVSSVATGLHSVKIMATKTSIKVYCGQERVSNVPKLDDFAAVGFRLGVTPYNNKPCILSSFRYAEGGKTLREQLDETGKIVTHGILFDSGSEKIKAESYKTLADIGQLLTENLVLRLSIEGYTDSDGADDYNMELSHKRANSVKTYLVDTYKIAGERLEAKGWGESKAIDTNDTPEGKANNRRVELLKL